MMIIEYLTAPVDYKMFTYRQCRWRSLYTLQHRGIMLLVLPLGLYPLQLNAILTC